MFLADGHKSSDKVVKDLSLYQELVKYKKDYGDRFDSAAKELSFDYALPEDTPSKSLETLEKKMPEICKEFVKKFYQTTDLEAAVKSQHEVMVHCSKFFALAPDKAKRLFE